MAIGSDSRRGFSILPNSRLARRTKAGLFYSLELVVEAFRWNVSVRLSQVAEKGGIKPGFGITGV
ncbi:MAG TPA: hypothetical protein V6C90_18245 [Coleofasciculaceae cyanobacterium]